MIKSTIILDIKNKEGSGLEDRHVDSSGSFKHLTNKQYKLLPFNTKWENSYANEFVYFNGILGEAYRRTLGKELPKELKADKDYDRILKQRIIKNAISSTETDNDEMEARFRKFISNMFFEEDNLFCFDKSTLPYLSFKTNSSTLKQIGAYIYELFLAFDSSFNESDSNVENILYKLIKESLPPLENKESESFGYIIWHKNIIETFRKDYVYLKTQNRTFLKNIGLLLKYYYFIYVSKIALSLGDFHNDNEHSLFFLLESEVVSKNREGFRAGWNMLEKRLTSLFTHTNTLELLNYIKVNGEPLGSYKEAKQKWDNFSSDEKSDLISRIKELEKYYKSKISMPNTGWDKCYEILGNQIDYKRMTCQLEKTIYQFWYVIDFQFKNTARSKPHRGYSLWFIEFCKANFIKRRGRIGYTLKMDQELLLFLTKLCIGNEKKIRLKTLWEELSTRGVNFDESSKMEVVKLFEKINLIEKKSDSGDAQYVRTIL